MKNEPTQVLKLKLVCPDCAEATDTFTLAISSENWFQFVADCQKCRRLPLPF